jgi:hypothetical protein
MDQRNAEDAPLNVTRFHRIGIGIDYIAYSPTNKPNIVNQKNKVIDRQQ